MRKLLWAAVIVAGSGFSAHAAMVVDGSISGDWGVNPYPGAPTRDGGQWTPSAPVDGFYEEDSVIGGVVGPGPGGQNYDIEAMYTARSGHELYFAMATGFDRGVQPGGYTAGAVFYDFGNDGMWDVAVQIDSENGFAAGQIWTGNGGVWWTDPNPYVSSTPWQVDTGNATNIGNVTSMAYVNNAWGGVGLENGDFDHNIYEFSFDATSWWGQIMNGGYTVHWTMGCGNDVAELVVDPSVVPEPATMTLLGLGLAGLAARRRMAKKA